MEETYLNNLTHDLSFRPGIIKEALARGVKFGSKEFFVYSQLRFYETDGKFGFCVAGDERLGEDVGMSPSEIKNALNRLKECGLVEHVWCDKRIYRNKTKLWVSTVRLSAVCTNVDAIKVLKDGRKNTTLLGKTVSTQTETVSPQTETVSPQTVASPVTTGVGNTNRNTKRNIGETLTLIHQNDSISSKTNEQDSLETCQNNSARAAAPFEEKPIIDVSKAKRPKLSEDRKFTMELIKLAEKPDKPGSRLTGLVTTQRKKFGDETLREYCKKLRFDKTLCKEPLQKCLSDYFVNKFLNKGNKVAKQNWWDDDDEDAWGDLC